MRSAPGGLRLRNDQGATMVEYGLLIALIVLVAVIGAAAFAQATTDLWASNSEEISNHTSHARS